MHSCSDCNSGSEFVNWYATTHSWTSLLKVCEGSKESGGIACSPTLKPSRSESALVHVVHWLHMILTSLDCYVWLFGDGLVKPSVLLGTKGLGIISEARYRTLWIAAKCHIESGKCYTEKFQFNFCKWTR